MPPLLQHLLQIARLPPSICCPVVGTFCIVRANSVYLPANCRFGQRYARDRPNGGVSFNTSCGISPSRFRDSLSSGHSLARNGIARALTRREIDHHDRVLFTMPMLMRRGFHARTLWNVKYWEIIADNLSKSDFSWSCSSEVECNRPQGLYSRCISQRRKAIHSCRR